MSESDHLKKEALRILEEVGEQWPKTAIFIAITLALLYIGSILDKHLSTIAKNTKKK